MSGKGDKQRPLSVNQETFSNNWERAFSTQEMCEYSGLPTPATVESIQREINELSNKLKAPDEYLASIQSGMFWELYPELSGKWELDAPVWGKKDVHR
jgi:hypothetical protein